MRIHSRLPSLALATAAASLSGGIGSQACAQEVDAGTPSEFEVSSSVAVVSDYRFRGWSLSNEGPAVQVDVGVEHSSGAYVGVFASSIEEYGGEEGGDGATVELDLYTGWSFGLSDWHIDIGAMAYLYPGAQGVDYFVLPVSLSRSFGDLTVTAGFEHTPAQRTLGGETSNYTWFEAEWTPQGLPVAFRSIIGHENGAMAPQGKVDWSASAAFPVETLEFAFSYVDSDERAAGSALVAEIRAYF